MVNLIELFLLCLITVTASCTYLLLLLLAMCCTGAGFLLWPQAQTHVWSKAWFSSAERQNHWGCVQQNEKKTLTGRQREQDGHIKQLDISTHCFFLLLLLFHFRCPTCSLGMRLTRSSATSSPSWSGNSPSDRPPTRTSTTTSCRACDTTSTWSCASRQWGRSSATERSSFRRWFPAAPWTGSAAGQRML